MASYAHYVLQKLHILPSVFCDLSLEEQAFIIASVDLQMQPTRQPMLLPAYCPLVTVS